MPKYVIKNPDDSLKIIFQSGSIPVGTIGFAPRDAMSDDGPILKIVDGEIVYDESLKIAKRAQEKIDKDAAKAARKSKESDDKSKDKALTDEISGLLAGANTVPKLKTLVTKIAKHLGIE